MALSSNTNQSLKTQLSLASLMFFSPFVQYLLQDSDLELSQEDHSFVKGYITLGRINIGLLVLTIAIGLVAYFSVSHTFSFIYTILIGILVALLCVESICAITETKLISVSSTSIHGLPDSIYHDKQYLLLTYLPGYNIYLWYHKHDFDNPDPIIKESLILWGIFVFSLLAAMPIISSSIGLCILVRVVSLVGNINIVPETVSRFFSSLFYKNPEEIWSYVYGTGVFLLHGVYTRSDWFSCIENIKKEYQYLYDVRVFGILHLQYFFLFIVFGFMLWQVDVGHLGGLSIVGIILIVLRYGLMISMLGRSPSLPLMRELGLIIQPLIRYFTSKK